MRPIYLAFCFAGLALVSIVPLFAQGLLRHAQYITVTHWSLGFGLLYLLVGLVMWWRSEQAPVAHSYTRPGLQSPQG